MQQLIEVPHHLFRKHVGTRQIALTMGKHFVLCNKGYPLIVAVALLAKVSCKHVGTRQISLTMGKHFVLCNKGYPLIVSVALLAKGTLDIGHRLHTSMVIYGEAGIASRIG